MSILLALFYYIFTKNDLDCCLYED